MSDVSHGTAVVRHARREQLALHGAARGTRADFCQRVEAPVVTELVTGELLVAGLRKANPDVWTELFCSARRSARVQISRVGGREDGVGRILCAFEVGSSLKILAAALPKKSVQKRKTAPVPGRTHQAARRTVVGPAVPRTS